MDLNKLMALQKIYEDNKNDEYWFEIFTKFPIFEVEILKKNNITMEQLLENKRINNITDLFLKNYINGKFIYTSYNNSFSEVLKKEGYKEEINNLTEKI